MHYTAEHARSYAAFRRIHGEVLSSLIEEGGAGEGSQVIEAGCGSCNYLRALREVTGCAASGFDPSEGMLGEARRLGGDLSLRQGRAEEIAGLFSAESADLVYSVDVIHHLGDLSAYFTGAHRVLKRGGRICTVTDSEQIIRNRRPLSEYWPETEAKELDRYPTVARIEQEQRRAGFQDLFALTVYREYRLFSAESYRQRTFSSLNLITAEEFERGLARLQRDLARGPIIANGSYVLLWGKKN